MEDQLYKYTIQYQYGTYSGTRVVYATDREAAIARMWQSLKRDMSLPMAYQSETVIEVEEYA